jgi:S1-C subfamily serine protease
MKSQFRSQLVAAVLGGLVVAGAFLALGITGRRTTRTIIEPSPILGQPASSSSSMLTANQIYIQDAPGVVFVRAEVVQDVQNPFDLLPEQQSSIATGSGFLVSRRGSVGYLLTNYHVIEGADRSTGVAVQFEDKVSRPATVIGVDQNNDLAVLQVDMTGLDGVMPLSPGDSRTVRVGDPTLAIGNPFGLDRTLTSGIVSALQRQIQAPDGFAIDNVIQTDAPINPGNSGGPLIDAYGRVIGINSQIFTGGQGNPSVGIAFAVPINVAIADMQRLELNRAQPASAYLGVGGAGSGHGVVISQTEPGSPAADAGLKQGDAIQSINGKEVRTMTDVQQIVHRHQPGALLAIRFRRAGQVRTAHVTLGAQSK